MDKPCAKCGTTGIYDTTEICKACYFENKCKYLEAKNQELSDHAQMLHNCLDEIPCKLCEKIE